MSAEKPAPGELSQKEQEIFRRDFQDKEREIQRYIGVYLSGLVLVTGWIIGPQSRPVLAMALGNGGYNVYAFLIFLVLNIAFTSFLVYKSLIIHEITQFMTLFASSDSPFLLWEGWRRSPYSATRPVRAIYTFALSVLPVFVSILLLYGVGNLLYTEPNDLVTRLARLEQPAVIAQSTVPSKESPTAPLTYLSSDQLQAVFATAKYWFFIVAALHAIPLYFIYVNIFPTYTRWTRIHRKKGIEDLFKTVSVSTDLIANEDHSFWLYEKSTNKRLAQLTAAQLQLLKDNLEEENSQDRDYYLNEDTLNMLERVGLDLSLSQTLRKHLRNRKSIEVEWRDEP